MLSAALLALTLTAPTQVSADAAREAQTLAHRSALEYDLGHAEDALRDIERAYLLDPLPGLLFNLGQCHRKLEHWKQAQEAYQGFLHYRPDAPNRETVLQLIAEMKREQVAASVPELGQTRTLPVPVERQPPPPPLPVAPAATPPPTAPPAPVEATTTTVETTTETPSHSHALGGVLFGAAAVSAGFAIYGAARVANWQSQAGGLGSPPTYANYVTLQNQIPNMNNWELASAILGGLAVAGVISGIFAW